MPNPNSVLLPGQFTKVKLLLDVREDAISVPQKAVTIEKGGAYIFVMRRDSIVEKRFIALGPEFGNNWVVERGLAAGEQVVTEGFHKLTPGMKVRAQAAIPDEEEKQQEDTLNKKVAPENKAKDKMCIRDRSLSVSMYRPTGSFKLIPTYEDSGE